MSLLASAFGYLVAAGVLVFALRRVVFSVIALMSPILGRSTRRHSEFLPTVALLVSARDEGAVIGRTLNMISRLDYPREKLQVLMIDDCSQDETSEIMKAHARRHPNFDYYRIPSGGSVGKASALNESLRMHPAGEIVYILDADSFPSAGCVRAAVQHFSESRIGAVTGAPHPSKACTTFAAYYAYLETLVTRSITTRAKDILGLAPGIFGSNCAYRRSALNTVGGFKDGAFLEDSELALRLYAGGYAVRFEPKATSHLAMPRSVSSYIRQHVRWTRGFNDILGEKALKVIFDKRLPVALRIELCLFASGYLDRVFLSLGVALAILGALNPAFFGFPLWVLALGFASPLLAIISALLICREPLTRHWRLPFLPVFFAVDIVFTLKGMLDTITNRPREWHNVEREVQVGAE